MFTVATRRALPFLSVLFLVALVPAAQPCEHCGMSGQTLSNELAQASMVLYGKLTNARLSDGGDGSGLTDLVIEKKFKPHKVVDGKNQITLKRYIPVDKNDDLRFLIYCDVFQDTIDPYRGVPVKAGSDLPKYVEGILKLKDAKIADRLIYCFDYLNDDDIEVANDALKEFGNSDHKEYSAIVSRLSAEKAMAWLKDPKTPSYRYGLLASVVGHSSKNKNEDAKELRKILEDPEKKVTSGVEGLLAGQAMLQPKEGWGYVRKILADPKQTFSARYQAMRAARFFIDFRTDVIARTDVIDGISLLLDQPDISDLAIEDLRRWKVWDKTKEILELRNKKSHDIPIIRRAILRFALSSPTPEAQQHVEDMRKKDPRLVKDAEALLKLENPPPPPPAETK